MSLVTSGKIENKTVGKLRQFYYNDQGKKEGPVATGDVYAEVHLDKKADGGTTETG